MKINGRLLLLAVVTGLFMRIWSGADRSHVGPVASRRPQPVVVQTSVEPTRSIVPTPSKDPSATSVGEPVECLTTGSVVSRPFEQAENWTEHSAPVPLPAGIVAGTWRVVDDTGRVARLVIAATSRPASISDETEFYVSQFQGRRWYFIRLNAPERIAAIVPSSVAADGTDPVEVVAPSPAVVPDVVLVPCEAATTGKQVSDAAPLDSASVEFESTPVAHRELSPELLAEIVAVRQDLQQAAQSAAEASFPVVVESAAQVDSAPLETTVRNRKFDFTGFGDSALSQSPESDDERPAPVDLPELY